MVLFTRAAIPVSAPGPEYSAAIALAQLTAAVGRADGAIAQNELAVLNTTFEQELGLVDDELRRLRAHLSYNTVAHPPTLGRPAKHSEALRPAQRREAGQLLLAVAAADGTITPDEVAALARGYEALGLDEAELYQSIHALSALGGEALQSVRLPGAPAPTYAIPKAPRAPAGLSGSVTLDPELVKAKLADSAKVAAYLAEIFTDDEGTDALAPRAGGTGGTLKEDAGPLVAGLDQKYSALLRRVAGTSQLDSSGLRGARRRALRAPRRGD